MISRSLRTFWAVRPPHPVIELLAGFVDALKTQCAQLGLKVTWLEPQSMHITLKFLGQVQESALPAMIDRVRRGLAELALTATSAPPLLLHGLSAFPDVRRPRVFFAEVRGEPAGRKRLGQLQQALEGWLAELGHAREERPFHPHLTLGRVRDGERAAKDLSSLFHHHGQRRFGEAFPIEEVILYESRLSSDGAIYVPVHTLALDGQPKENVSHGN